MIAYLIVRTRFFARSTLDLLVWLPSTLPGIVMGLGYLYLFLGTPFLRPIYGTTFILVLVAALGSITLTTQVLKTNLRQLGAELEEASATSGGNWWHTLRHIILPLMAPSLAVVGVLAFSAAARATSHVALAVHTQQPAAVDFAIESVIGQQLRSRVGDRRVHPADDGRRGSGGAHPGFAIGAASLPLAVAITARDDQAKRCGAGWQLERR